MFRQITNQVFASPQIGLAEVAEAKAQGITLIINNRPEDESADQTPGADVEAAANAAMLQELAQWYAQGKIKPVIDHTLPMSALKQAYAEMGSRSVMGKLVMVNT